MILFLKLLRFSIIGLWKYIKWECTINWCWIYNRKDKKAVAWWSLLGWFIVLLCVCFQYYFEFNWFCHLVNVIWWLKHVKWSASLVLDKTVQMGSKNVNCMLITLQSLFDMFNLCMGFKLCDILVISHVKDLWSLLIAYTVLKIWL